LASAATKPWRALGSDTAREKSSDEDIFWALREISFEVKQGEVVGIIGRNGAGKSTLLKILSRVTEPTTGCVQVRGRVASLLEVGTGFHPELTGRENIYLNGAVLGMKRAEIQRNFDEIVAFADVEKFLDTPVKHYSSGMYVRLAFAVAAHLEPDVLVVDEVLAVGDAQFQRKCLGKMKSIAAGLGRTVLFVSHNVAAVQTLCSTAILLASGKLVSMGNVNSQVQSYTAAFADSRSLGKSNGTPLSSSLTLERLSLTPSPVLSGAAVHFQIRVRSATLTHVNEMAILLYSGVGTRVAIVDLRSAGGYEVSPANALELTGTVRSLPLVEGDYSVGLYISCGDIHGDFYDLSALSVSMDSKEREFAPYAAHDRGLLELSYDFARV
jgi:lipopolysaccharide transport system ATP-binding protein